MVAPALRRLVNAPDHLREELAVQIGEDNADGRGAIGDETARGAVRRISKPGGDVEDVAPRVIGHGCAPVAGTGHRGDRHAGFACNVLDGHHERAPRSRRSLELVSAGGGVRHVNVYRNRLHFRNCQESLRPGQGICRTECPGDGPRVTGGNDPPGSIGSLGAPGIGRRVSGIGAPAEAATAQYFPRYSSSSHWLTCEMYSRHSSRLAARKLAVMCAPSASRTTLSF